MMMEISVNGGAEPEWAQSVPSLLRVGKYRIDQIIGRGAVGIVYRGYDEQIDRPLAIKTLRPEILGEIEPNSEALKRFAIEARSAGRCLHPNIVTVFDYVEQNGAPFIIMEYIDAGTLDSVIKSGTLLPVHQAGEIMCQLLLALEHAHAKGVIHRDIKPSNILCLSATSIKISDFGVAHIDSLELTRTNGMSAIGTPNYMAPERFSGRPADARSDLFSAGVVLFQLLTGAKPFTATDMPELVRKLSTEAPASLAAARPDLAAAFDPVVRKCLARNPDDRFQSAAALITAINHAIDHIGAHAQPPLDLTKYSTISSKDQVPTSTTGSLNQTMADRLQPNTLEALEHSLARTIGPMAKLLVRKASRESTDAERLLASLTEAIKADADAARFRLDAERMLRADQSATGVQLFALIGTTDVEAATAALLPLVGPMARVLVLRTAKTAVGREDFFQRLADHIPSAADRSAFLATKRKPYGATT